MDANDRIIFCCLRPFYLRYYTFLRRLGAAVVPSIKKAGYISMTQDELEKWIKQLIAEDNRKRKAQSLGI